ncbi:hypothetical protein [Microlunatus soli]|uniref:hypothetical protein n=1 Tax=Microlunatus soli TaxID=630515 RepID=UPI0012F74ED3|nr:hypothetical protein [Microlunatus soli]
MSQQDSEELVVPYDAQAAQDRVQRWQRMVRSRLISLGLSVVLLIVIFVWQRDRLMANPGPTFAVYGVVLLIGIGWLVGTLIALRAARRAAAGVGSGVALRVNRRGVEIAGQQVGWHQLASLGTTKGSWPVGPELRVRRNDGAEVAVPLEQLAIRPATLDGTVRAYSGGRFGVDLEALDI